jgi:nucleotide-binding universal stress UspA family protein
MLSFKKILCPTDFSQHSYEALKAANELGLKFGARLYLLHVIAPVPIITAAGTPMTAGIGPSEFNVPFYQQELKTSAVRKLRELVKRRKGKNWTHRYRHPWRNRIPPFNLWLGCREGRAPGSLSRAYHQVPRQEKLKAEETGEQQGRKL